MAEPFTLKIGGDKLIKGLRPFKRLGREDGYLVQCQGAVGRQGSLQALDALTRMATTAITDGFPYPQLFVFTSVIIVCGATKIYEWVSGSLVLKLTITAGSTWSAVDFFEYVYLSNGTVAVIRRSTDKVFVVDATLPTAQAMVNVNGQVMIGGLI